MVSNARHAVALDEQRELFAPALWGNLTGADGLNKGSRDPARPYQQVWFIGTHGIVGGSSGTRQLVAYPLEWIPEGAIALGLKLRPDVVVPDDAGNPVAVTSEIDPDHGVLKGWRSGPDDPICCHWSVGERARKMQDAYQPDTIRLVLASLLTPPPPAAGEAAKPETRHA
jgi:uncharacterized protein (DUF2235 family)